MRSRLPLPAVLCLFLCIISPAQEHLTLSAEGTYSYLPPNIDKFYRMLLETGSCATWSIQAGYNTLSSDADPYAEAYNYPTMGFGLTWSEFNLLKFKNNSHYNDTYAAYFFLERPIWKKRAVDIGYFFRFGVGYTPDHYDPYTNPANLFLGSHVMAYAAAGGQFRFHPTEHLELDANLYFYHYSNGKFCMPNGGWNTADIGLAVKYNVGSQERRQVCAHTIPCDYPRGLHWDICAIGGSKIFDVEWQAKNRHVDDVSLKQTSFTRIWRHGISADATWRYSMLCSSGLSLDVYHSTGMDVLRECDALTYGQEKVDETKYSPYTVDIGAMHEFFYKNISATCTVGLHLHNHYGIYEDTGLLYQKLGFRVYFPNLGGLFFGWCVKAYVFSKADCLEASIGIRLR